MGTTKVIVRLKRDCLVGLLLLPMITLGCAKLVADYDADFKKEVFIQYNNVMEILYKINGELRALDDDKRLNQNTVIEIYRKNNVNLEDKAVFALMNLRLRAKGSDNQEAIKTIKTLKKLLDVMAADIKLGNIGYREYQAMILDVQTEFENLLHITLSEQKASSAPAK